MTRALDSDEEEDASCSRYDIVDLLGRGSFGEVYKAIDCLTGDNVALKRIFVREPSQGIPENVLREYKGLQILQDENIIKLLNIYVEGQSMVLVQEYCETDMHSLIRESESPLPVPLIKRLMQDLLQGVRAIHAAGIIHRDLKPSNLLLDAGGVLKIGDFGLCRPLLPPGGQYSFSVPSKTYRAPELLFGAREYDGRAVDMWSVGCIFAELLGKAPLFEAEGEIQQLRAIMNILGNYEPSRWGGQKKLPDFGKIRFPDCQRQPLASILPDAPISALHLLEQMLMYDPACRPTAEQALRHAYFFEDPYPSGAFRACTATQALMSVNAPCAPAPKLAG